MKLVMVSGSHPRHLHVVKKSPKPAAWPASC